MTEHCVAVPRNLVRIEFFLLGLPIRKNWGCVFMVWYHRGNNWWRADSDRQKKRNRAVRSWTWL